MCFMLKSEVVAVKCGLKPRRSVHEKEGVSDSVFLGEFMDKPFREIDRTRRMRPLRQKLVRYRINRCQQPVAFVVQLNHGLL